MSATLQGMPSSRPTRSGKPDVRWLRRRLLVWGRTHFRDFAWRRDRDPYRSLVTEVLLKQTQADRIEPVRSILLRRYPSSGALARAPRRDIENLIKGLGFGTQRAVHLRALGAALTGSKIPRDAKRLANLPGIGPYAAAATACFVFGRTEIALDVNVARILSRVFGLRLEKGELRKNRGVLQLGQLLVDGPRPRELNWALLDLGALICRPRPKCEVCPLAVRCSYANCATEPDTTILPNAMHLLRRLSSASV